MRGFSILGLLALAAAGTAATAQGAGDERQPSFIRIAPGGLTAGQPGLHPYASFPFGMRRGEVTRRIAALSGGAGASGIGRGCGARPLAFARFGTLTLYFRNERFVGWSLAGPRARRPIESEWQLGIGATRDELSGNDAEVRFTPTAGGTAFAVDGMHGLLTGRGARARVSALWAGVTCRGR